MRKGAERSGQKHQFLVGVLFIMVMAINFHEDESFMLPRFSGLKKIFRGPSSLLPSNINVAKGSKVKQSSFLPDMSLFSRRRDPGATADTTSLIRRGSNPADTKRFGLFGRWLPNGFRKKQLSSPVAAASTDKNSKALDGAEDQVKKKSKLRFLTPFKYGFHALRLAPFASSLLLARSHANSSESLLDGDTTSTPDDQTDVTDLVEEEGAYEAEVRQEKDKCLRKTESSAKKADCRWVCTGNETIELRRCCLCPLS